MDKKVTIYDIAREAGVSTATVTRVTSGDPRVKASTREKVQRVIDAYAYTPSAAARNLEGGNSKTLAIVLPQILNPYFTRMFDAANAASRVQRIHALAVSGRRSQAYLPRAGR